MVRLSGSAIRKKYSGFPPMFTSGDDERLVNIMNNLKKASERQLDWAWDYLEKSETQDILTEQQGNIIDHWKMEISNESQRRRGMR